MRRAGQILAAGFCLLAAMCGWAAGDAIPGGEGIVVMTRYMQIFSALETELTSAVNARDNARLDTLLGEFFEVRRADGTTLQRSQWLERGIASDAELHGLS